MGTRVRGRHRRYVDTVDFLDAVGRMLRAAGERVAEADEEELAALARLEQQLSNILLEAVRGLRRSGATWETIGAAMGTTRQGAQQRWGPRLEPSSNGHASAPLGDRRTNPAPLA